MLRLKNIVKRYAAKGGTIEALNDVSVDFPERGMVFLLGKSGSGKSTLLNIAGGLDAPDEGELIVGGKSSAQFTREDYDSYRNTYVGFVFQEYNILNELTVAENIALAVELQGGERDLVRVREILGQVDLGDYGDRRPNTLSGGQKQRVAIARALIKDPKIIMADEPTGALDSATGVQVFDTLKKLSADRLVVVVSHDREFAERYADRIIELRDGKIISDVTRGEEGVRSNVAELSADKLTIDCGAALTEEEGARILAFVRRNKKRMVLSAAEEDVRESASGAAGIFRETVLAPKEETEEPVSFLRSKFPMRYAVKMGVAGLKVKPVRLVFTVLLAAVAFLVFGVFSTLLTYNVNKIGAETLAEADYGAAVLTKKAIMHYSDGETRKLSTGNYGAYFTTDEAEALSAEYDQMNFIPVYDFGRTMLSFSGNQGTSRGAFYDAITSFAGFAEFSRMTGKEGRLAAGVQPQSVEECVVSELLFESFAFCGFKNPDGTIHPIASYEDLLGKWISVSVGIGGAISLKVVGVFDTGEDFSDYEQLLIGEDSPLDASEKLELQRELDEIFTYSMASLCYVADTFYEANSNRDLTRGLYNSAMNSFTQEYGATTKYSENPADGRRYQYLYAARAFDDGTRAKTLMLLLYDLEDEERDVCYSVPYAFVSDLVQGDTLFDDIFAIVGSVAAALAVFAALLQFGFISGSINAKRRDIGVLRAVGARGVDVFKIFIVEGLIVALLCFALGCGGSLLVCRIANDVLMSRNVLSFSFFLFDWVNALILLGISLLTALFAVSVPVALTARKKPIEAIRSV